MYFSISAPQQVTLPNGQILSFRVNTQDSSLCELHIKGRQDGSPVLANNANNDGLGTHILTFKRNGTPSDTSFVPMVAAPGQPGYKTNAPLTPEQVEANRVAQAQSKPAPYPSANDGAVRADDWQSGSAPADYQGLDQRGPYTGTPAEIEAKKQADLRAGPQGQRVNTTQDFRTPVVTPRPS